MITTTDAPGTRQWEATAPDGTRIRMRSPGPDLRFWRLIVSAPSAGWTDDGATPDEAVGNWVARITPDRRATAGTLLLVLQIAKLATQWLQEQSR